MTHMETQHAAVARYSVEADGTVNSGAKLTDDEARLYHPDCGLDLEPLHEQIQLHAVAIIERLFQDMLKLPRSELILETLSAEELKTLKEERVRHLLLLAAPDLTVPRHRMFALEIGRARGIMGLDREGMVRMLGMLIGAVRHYIDAGPHSAALDLLELRLIRDLAWQAEAGQRLQTSRQQVLLQILRFVRESDNYTDLIHGVVQILGGHDEVAGCSVGRPDSTGVFRFESVSGATMETYLSEVEAHQPIMAGRSPRALGPAGRAWQSGLVQRAINIATDAQMVPWRALSLQAGFRSSVAIPLHQPGRTPKAILSLYSAFPGGYTAVDQATFIENLQIIVGLSIARIDALRGGTSTMAYATRQRLSALVRSDALRMYYQPLIDLKSGRVAKVEALARLQDGDRVLAPGEFFSALSSDDFLGLYQRGLAQTLAQRQQWLAQGIALNVSVNVPPNALSDLRYFEATQQALSAHQCNPHHLTLEILETDAFPLGIDVSRELARLKSLGIKLAQDDLGSGHSSLARLREVPFDFVKIDRSVISLTDEEPRDVLRFVWQLIQLGHSLGKAVIVEGVENDDMLEAVVILGADFAQGYGIARPMPAAQVALWLKSRPANIAFDQPSTPLGRLAQQLIHDDRLGLIVADGVQRTA